MNSRGFSLIETVMTVACLAALLAIGTLMFQRYDRSFRVEAQTRLVLTELMKARMHAITQHRVTRVTLYPDRFEVYSTASDRRDGADPLTVQRLGFPLTSNVIGFDGGFDVDFLETGLTRRLGSFCVDAGGAQPAFDSIVISATRIASGIRDKGNECASANITIK